MINELSKPLQKEDVEVRIGSVFEGKGFTLLLYKTARADIKRLNEVCGLDWKNEHFFDEKGNIGCRISIKNKDGEWITREDIGVASNMEAEKGGYSDSFKRAGFRWGIGLELYNAPFIYISWKEWQGKKPKFYPFKVSITEYKVVKGEPKLTITYDGKVLFSNIKE